MFSISALGQTFVEIYASYSSLILFYRYTVLYSGNLFIQ